MSTRTHPCEFWNSRAIGYAEDFRGAPIRAFAVEEIVSFVRDQRPRTLLDLGCGAGLVAARLAREFPELRITLVDFSQPMLDEARQRLPDKPRYRFLRTSFDDLSEIASGSVDAAISSFALHHVVDDQKVHAFKELRRVLYSLGRALIIDEIICDPAFEEAERLFRHMGDLFYPWLSDEELRRKFAGFEEYPSPIGRIEEMCRASRFSVVARPINGIVASLLLTPIKKRG
jgi:SAM-dependent methyltransferase